MKFVHDVGIGLLYGLLFPFLLLAYVCYGVYGLFYGVFFFFKGVVRFFKGEKKPFSPFMKEDEELEAMVAKEQGDATAPTQTNTTTTTSTNTNTNTDNSSHSTVYVQQNYYGNAKQGDANTNPPPFGPAQVGQQATQTPYYDATQPDYRSISDYGPGALPQGNDPTQALPGDPQRLSNNYPDNGQGGQSND